MFLAHFSLMLPTYPFKKQMQYHSYKQSLWYSACVPFTTQSEGLWYATHWDEFVCSPPKNPNNMQPSVDDVVRRSNADWLKSCLEQERDTSFTTEGNRCEKIINDQNSSVRRTVLQQTVWIVSSKSFLQHIYKSNTTTINLVRQLWHWVLVGFLVKGRFEFESQHYPPLRGGMVSAMKLPHWCYQLWRPRVACFGMTVKY